jgi:two-component system chemotaxis sensor kinase CheA
MDDLIADFLTETNESLSDLDFALVKLEQAPDDQDTLSLIFRLVHTIKGTCGFLGLPRLERVAHAAESVLGKVRDGVLAATPDTVTVVLAALDRVKAIVGGLASTGSEPAGDDSELVAALDAAAAGEAPKVAQAPAPEPEAEGYSDAAGHSPPTLSHKGRGKAASRRQLRLLRKRSLSLQRNRFQRIRLSV